MIDAVKAIEPETGFGPILAISTAESAMREARIRRTKTVCTYCGVGCSFDVWTRDRHILKIEPAEGPANGISTCIKGKFAWDFINADDRPGHAAHSSRDAPHGPDTFREATWDEALTLIAETFTKIKKRHGADALEFTQGERSVLPCCWLNNHLRILPPSVLD